MGEDTAIGGSRASIATRLMHTYMLGCHSRGPSSRWGENPLVRGSSTESPFWGGGRCSGLLISNLKRCRPPPPQSNITSALNPLSTGGHKEALARPRKFCVKESVPPCAESSPQQTFGYPYGHNSSTARAGTTRSTRVYPQLRGRPTQSPTTLGQPIPLGRVVRGEAFLKLLMSAPNTCVLALTGLRGPFLGKLNARELCMNG